MELLGLESSRQKPPRHWQTVAYGGLTERSLMSQIPSITPDKKFDRVAQSFIGRVGDKMSLTEGTEQKSAGPLLTMVRSKKLPAVPSESADLVLVKFLQAEPFGREPFVQLNHDPNDALTRKSGVSLVHEQAGKVSQVRAKRPTTAPTQEFGV